MAWWVYAQHDVHPRAVEVVWPGETVVVAVADMQGFQVAVDRNCDDGRAEVVELRDGEYMRRVL